MDIPDHPVYGMARLCISRGAVIERNLGHRDGMMESEHILGVPLFLESTQPGQLPGRVQHLVTFISVSVVNVQLRGVESRCLQERCAPLFAELVDELLVYGVFPGVIEQAANG